MLKFLSCCLKNNKNNKKIISVEYKELGNKCYNNKDYNTALEWYFKGLNLDNDNHTILLNISFCYYKLNNFNNCLKTINKYLLKEKNNYKAYNLKAISLIKTNNNCISNISEALLLFKTAINEYSNNISTNKIDLSGNNKLFTLKNNYKKCLKYLKILQINNRNTEINDIINYLKPKDIFNKEKIISNLKSKIFDINNFIRNNSNKDYLFDNINLELLDNAVTIETGLSYSKLSLEKYFELYKYKDPISNNPLKFQGYLMNINLNKTINFLINNSNYILLIDNETNENNIIFEI